MIRTLKSLENSGQLNGVTEKVTDEKKKSKKAEFLLLQWFI